MSKTEWVLPSLKGTEGEVWTITNDSRLDKTLTRAIQAESDLREALDLLEKISKQARGTIPLLSKEINLHLSRFRT